MAASCPQILFAQRTWFQAQTEYVASLGVTCPPFLVQS